jgi:hypothetical protein
MVGKQIVFGIIANCILGVVLAQLNKSART